MEEYILQYCKQCANIIYINPNDGDVIYTCPICGSIEDLSSEVLVGEFTLASPEVVVENLGDDKIELRLGDSDVDDAIKTLVSNGWKIKFIKND